MSTPRSIYDVARAADVSITTVSRVMGTSTRRVRPATRERVLRAVGELGYSPSALARALVTRQTRLVGVLVGDATDPYFAGILRGVEDTARANGYLVLLCNTDREADVELRYLHVLRDYRADGILFAGGCQTDPAYLRELEGLVTRMREHGTAIVALARYPFGIPEVGIDNTAATGCAVEHLLELGHRRIAFIGGRPGVSTSEERLAAYRSVLEAAGLRYDPVLVLPGDYTYSGGRRAADLLLAISPRPTAVLAINDASAVGCLVALKEHGLRVPAEISVAGINDIPAAHYVEPALTTVSVPIYELGAIGMRHLLRGLAGEAVPPSQRLEHDLVVRRSTAPPPRSRPRSRL